MTRGVPALWSRLRATIEMDTNGIMAYTQKRFFFNNTLHEDLIYLRCTYYIVYKYNENHLMITVIVDQLQHIFFSVAVLSVRKHPSQVHLSLYLSLEEKYFKSFISQLCMKNQLYLKTYVQPVTVYDADHFLTGYLSICFNVKTQ